LLDKTKINKIEKDCKSSPFFVYTYNHFIFSEI
jgi:hypothetical protein